MSGRRFVCRAVLGCVLFAPALAGTPAAGNGPATAASWSAAELYNDANAQARAGKPGLATLGYERARLLAPHDPDIVANLRFVSGQAGVAAPEQNRFERIASLGSPALAFWLGCAGVLCLGSSALAAQRRRTRPLLRRSAAVAGLMLLGYAIANATVTWSLLHEAVVVADGATARVAPASTAAVLFPLPQAQRVTIIGTRGPFVLVRTGPGREGWAERAVLESVVPEIAAPRS